METKKIKVDLIQVNGNVTTITHKKITVPDNFVKPGWVRFCVDMDNAWYFYDTYPYSDIHPPEKLLTLGKGVNQ